MSICWVHSYLSRKSKIITSLCFLANLYRICTEQADMVTKYVKNVSDLIWSVRRVKWTHICNQACHRTECNEVLHLASRKWRQFYYQYNIGSCVLGKSWILCLFFWEFESFNKLSGIAKIQHQRVRWQSGSFICESWDTK